jgi:MscS family membrane protein
MKKIIFFLLILVSTSLISSEIEIKDAEKLLSPRDAAYVHLYYLQENSYNREKSALALKTDGLELNIEKELAVKLKEILDAKGLYVKFDEIPDDSDYVDSVSNESKFVLFESIPEIYLSKYGKKWKYSEETVDIIPELYKAVYPFKLSKIIKSLPGFLQSKFIFDLYIWQVIFLIAYFVIAYVLFRIVNWSFGYLLIRIISRFKFKDIASKFIQPVSKPVTLIIIVLLLLSFLPLLELPVGFNNVIGKILQAFIPAFVTVIAYRLCDFLGEFVLKIAEKTESTLDDNLVPLGIKILKVIVIVFGFIYILQIFDISVTPLIAGVSIGGLAFALAAQDTVRNLFGSLTIFTDQPFKIGDWIVFEGMEGTVIEVGVRSTRVRTFYDSVISIPNGKLADIKVDNMGERAHRRFYSKIHLTYDSPPEKVQEFVDKLKVIVENQKDTWKDYYQIYVNNLGERSIEILFYIFFDVPDWGKELEARHNVIMEILKLAQRLDLRFAYPIRDYSKEVKTVY